MTSAGAEADERRSAQMSGHGEKLSRRREAAIAALLNRGTVAAAAKDAGVAESTLRRWLREPAFAEGYRSARSETLTHAIAALQRGLSDAATTLRRNLKGGSRSTQNQAARVILEHALRAAELVDLTERIEALERTGNGGQPQ